MRLINAVDYRKELEEELKFHRDCDNREIVQGLEIAIADLGEAPTIEAKSVVHAYWKKFRTTTRALGEDVDIYWYGCSACERDIPKTSTGVDWFTTYCPHCGAIMDKTVIRVNVHIDE